MRLSSSKVVAEIIESLKPVAEPLKVEQVVIGLFYTGVRLSGGWGGVAYTPHEWIVDSLCCPELQGRMPLTGKLSGMKAVDAMMLAQGGNLLLRAVGVAAINAASAPILFRENVYEVEYDADALKGVELRRDDRVVMIGAFKPYLQTLREKGVKLTVYEKNPALLKELGLKEPETRLEDALREADLVIVTGSAFVVSNIDEILLTDLGNSREVIVVGPSSSMVPDPLFKHGVTALGGLRITSPEKMIQVVAEAGGTKSLLKYAGRKFLVRRKRGYSRLS